MIYTFVRAKYRFQCVFVLKRWPDLSKNRGHVSSTLKGNALKVCKSRLLEPGLVGLLSNEIRSDVTLLDLLKDRLWESESLDL